MNLFRSILAIATLTLAFSCNSELTMNVTSPEAILGSSGHLAISYGGYRGETRHDAPSVNMLKEDLRILAAMGVRIIRTYNTQDFPQAGLLLKAISELKEEEPGFEMYLMMGAWIQCENAWTDSINHEGEDLDMNTREIETAIEYARSYPDIVKVIAVGNEAMIHWAQSYFVRPKVILKWVNYLQDIKASGELAEDLWITSSDNYVSWGGGEQVYHTEDLNELIKAVDFLSIHTYAFHESHYVPYFWGVMPDEEGLSDLEKIEASMDRALEVSQTQYQSVVDYLKAIGVEKRVHIGECGWASVDNSIVGPEGSRAADEYKEKLYYDRIREWTGREGIACFYFEAFDEHWKDDKNSMGSENHFGLFTLEGQAKYPLWDLVDKGVFNGLGRNGIPISKTYRGDEAELLKEVLVPPSNTSAVER